MIYACDACRYLFASDNDDVQDFAPIAVSIGSVLQRKKRQKNTAFSAKRLRTGTMKSKTDTMDAILLDKQKFKIRMNRIVKALKDASYDPYTQLYGYISTGNITYITRQSNARDEIKKLDRQMVREFTMELKASE